jgi:hypothetical protein
MMVFGARNGFAADAGHNDSLVGLASRQTVYPYIESWISSR